MYLTLNPQKKYLTTPFKFIFTYTLITFISSLIGPVKFLHYTISVKIITSIYITLFLVFTWIGMSIGMMNDVKYEQYNERSIDTRNNFSRTIKLLNITTIIALTVKILLVVSSIMVSGIPEITTFFETLATVYTTMHRTEPAENIFRAINTFTTFISYISIVGNIFMWKINNKVRKFSLLIIIFLDLVYNLFFIGTQRSIFTYVIIFFTYFLVSNAKKLKRIKIGSKIKVFVLLILVVVLSMNMLYARKQFWGSNFSQLEFKSGMSYDFDNIFISFLPDQIKYNVSTVISYFTQGYYGLGLSLTSNFEWTYGMGSIRGLLSIARQLLPMIPDMTLYTYPLRVGMEYNFDGLANWYTIFPWLASDLTFLGTLIYMGGVGYIYMKVWIEAIRFNNILSSTVLFLLNIQYVFLVANNQLFIGRGESLATIVIFISWIIWRKKFNWFSSPVDTKRL